MSTKGKVFTRQTTAVKMTVLFSQHKEEIQNKTLDQIYAWVRSHENFDFEGEDSVNMSGLKATLDTLGIKPKTNRKPITERRDRVRVIAATMIRLAQKMEQSIGAEPGTILSNDDKELLESL